MPADYIPPTDAALALWSTNFNAVIVADEAAYGLTPAQSAAYTALDSAFQTALALATDPGTRTPVTVADKDTAKANLIFSARQLGQIAQTYPAITDMLLADAGLTVPDPIPTPIPAPVTKPVVSIFDTSSLQVVIRFKDSVLSNPRAKPPGATGMEVFVKVGTTPPASIADCVYRGIATKVPYATTYEPTDALKNAYYLCRWITRRGLTGPVSDLFSATIPA